ncbi:hypothetical protein ACQP1U_08220 [Actinomycetota bacterium]
MSWTYYAIHGVIGLAAFGGIAALGHLRWKDNTEDARHLSPADNGLD